MNTVTPCETSVDECRSVQPGHQAHTVQATLAGKRPEDWLDASVSRIEGLVIALSVAGKREETIIWHHCDLSNRLARGRRVRIHASQPLIEVDTSWLSVARSTDLE